MTMRSDTSARSRTSRARFALRLLCWLVSYASAAAITMQLLTERPAKTGIPDHLPLVAAARETLVDGCWDPAELLDGASGGVILASAPFPSQAAGKTVVLSRN